MIRYLRDFATTSLSGDSALTTITGNLKVTANTNATSASAGAIVTPGGIAAGKDLYIGGNLFVAGNTTTVSTNNLSVQDSIIELHVTNDNLPLTSDDGRDIGIRARYYQSGDKTAFFGWSNNTGNFEYYSDATESSNGKITGNLGKANFGSLSLTNVANDALTVSGGASFGGNIYAQGVFYSNGVSVATTLSFLGGEIINATTVLNTATSTSTTTGALQVRGGTGIAGNTYIGGRLITTGPTTLNSTLTVGSTLAVSGISTASTFIDKVVSVSSNNNFLTLDLSLAATFRLSLEENVTQLSITNVPAVANSAVQFVLMVTSDGTERTIVWPDSFKWPNNTAPTLTNTANKTDIFVFLTVDAGTTWRAIVAGQAYD